MVGIQPIKRSSGIGHQKYRQEWLVAFAFWIFLSHNGLLGVLGTLASHWCHPGEPPPLLHRNTVQPQFSHNFGVFSRHRIFVFFSTTFFFGHTTNFFLWEFQDPFTAGILPYKAQYKAIFYGHIPWNVALNQYFVGQKKAAQDSPQVARIGAKNWCHGSEPKSFFGSERRPRPKKVRFHMFFIGAGCLR